MDYPPSKTKIIEAKPDLAILIVASYRVVVDRLLDAMRASGLSDMKPAYGFVIRAVGEEAPSINRLAEMLDASKQMASKLADEMVRKGFLLREEDPADRRILRLRLSAKGVRVRKTALALGEQLEAEIAGSLGEQGVVDLRMGLLALLCQHGALEEVLAKRARPVW